MRGLTYMAGCSKLLVQQAKAFKLHQPTSKETMAAPKPSSVYASKHDPATLRTHQWRTAANSAGHLLPHLKPNMTILDVGCGPGTITVDLARNYVPQGHVTGVEYAEEPLRAAQEHAAALGVTNVTLTRGDVLNLSKDYPEESFDVVYAHQVVQHVPDPVRALREMRRVVKKGGIVAVRESAAMTWYPPSEGMDKWYKLYRTVATGLGGNPDPGSRLHVWAKEAGFAREDISCSTGTWCFSTPEERRWWSQILAERLLAPSYIETVVEKGGYCSLEDLEELSQMWRDWGENEDGWFNITHGEIICRKT